MQLVPRLHQNQPRPCGNGLVPLALVELAAVSVRDSQMALRLRPRDSQIVEAGADGRHVADGYRTNHRGAPVVSSVGRHACPRSLPDDVWGRAKILLELLATIHRGPQIRIAEVKFQGQKKTRPSLLSRRVRVKRGELLDRVKAEEGRFRLAQLGIFDSVDLNYKPVDEHSREVSYQVKEGKQLNVSMLFGYGSYELLRGGFEVEQYNIWGRAHHARLKVIQSFKASSADFSYTLPEFVGKDVDIFVNASGLRREEISFTREEYGGGLGAHKYFKPIATDLSVRYNYQILRAAELAGSVTPEGITNTSVGAIITELKHDRRDNPLYPRKGYKIFGTLELATEYLAGDVNYQRLDLSSAWHQPIGGGRVISLGLSHGVVLSIGAAAQERRAGTIMRAAQKREPVLGSRRA